MCSIIQKTNRSLNLNPINHSNPTYVSPTDNILTPVSQKLNATKKKHFTKYVFSFTQDVGQY